MIDSTTDTTDTDTDAEERAGGTAGTETVYAVLAGPDDDALGAALSEQGITVTRIDGVANRDALEKAGIADADLFVLTDVRQATAIPVAKELNPEIKAVTYAHRSLPEFVRGQADLSIDPDLLGPTAVAEELAA